MNELLRKLIREILATKKKNRYVIRINDDMGSADEAAVDIYDTWPPRGATPPLRQVVMPKRLRSIEDSWTQEDIDFFANWIEHLTHEYDGAMVSGGLDEELNDETAEAPLHSYDEWRSLYDAQTTY